MGACTICLDNDPLPIQAGCACRGDAGLAHVECRAMAAAHRLANGKLVDGWWKCATCGQEFTGAMQLGLAEAWWSTAQRLPEEDEERLGAGGILASALDAHGKHAEAVTLYREVLVARRRVMGPEHPDTLLTANNLAIALDYQGKHAEAVTLLREVLVARRRVLGPEHPSTLTTANNLAAALDSQGKHAEAVTMHREVLAVKRRVLGPEHPDTLATANNLATALGHQGKHAEAVTVYRELLPIVRRVMGPEHPHTLATAINLAACSRAARSTPSH
jgi:tetratricopeptide (TPR) repeat protein